MNMRNIHQRAPWFLLRNELVNQRTSGRAKKLASIHDSSIMLADWSLILADNHVSCTSNEEVILIHKSILIGTPPLYSSACDRQ